MKNTAAEPENTLCYKSSAQKWEEALPLGNGRMGMMMYGGPDAERLDLSEITFYSGEADRENCNADAPRALEEMKKLLLQGDYGEASKFQASLYGRKKNYGTNLPVGVLLLEKQKAKGSCSPAADYKRCLHMREGKATVSGIWEGCEEEREAFVSNPYQTCMFRWKTTAPEGLHLRITFQDVNDEERLPEYTVCKDENGNPCGRILFVCKARESLHSDGSCGVDLYGCLEVSIRDGSVLAKKDALLLEGASCVECVLAMNTGFGAEDKAGKTLLEKSLEQVKKVHKPGYDTVLKSHESDFAEAYDRSYFRLPREKECGSLYMEDRLERVKEGKEDWGLAAVLFQYGKYLFLSSARENSPLPAHLQGVWNDNVACRMVWTCDLHLDINTQMNYWPCESLGLGECSRPLFAWIKDILMPSGELTARDMYGSKGWVAHIFSNAWGYCAPGWGDCWSVHVTGGAWIASHLWEHYRYHKDEAFLEKELWPVYRGLARFFLDYLTWDPNRQVYVTGPSISPENLFLRDGKKYAFSMGPTADIVIVRDILNACMEILQMQPDENLSPSCQKEREDMRFRIRQMADKLPGFSIGKDGRLLEWQEELEEADRHHRHTSHLLAVYPFRQIHAESSSRLREAALASLNGRFRPEELWEDTGWARALLLLYAACLHRPEDCLSHIRHTLSHAVTGNLMVMHPPTAGAQTSVYELDGNTGYTAGVVEMLAHRIADSIYLLPAVPEEWPEGEAGGICLPGGITLWMKWSAKRLEAQMQSDEEQMVWIIWKGERRRQLLHKGKTGWCCEIRP